jgi:hypothetical protein
MAASAEPFDPLAAPLLGAASHGRLALPAGRVIELAGSFSPASSRQAGRPVAISCVLALALHQRWLRERDDRDLTRAIGYVHDAAGQLPDDHQLRRRIMQLQASLLLDRSQVTGDHADAAAAVAVLAELARAPAGPPPPDLNQLLAGLIAPRARRKSGKPDLSELLSPPCADAVTSDTYAAELAAETGAAQLQCALLSGRKDERDSAIANLALAARHLPGDHPLRPDALSTLGLARLADADCRDDAAGVRASGGGKGGAAAGPARADRPRSCSPPPRASPGIHARPRCWSARPGRWQPADQTTTGCPSIGR